MARLMVRDPWRDFETLHDRINRLFDRTLRTFYPEIEEELERRTWSPAVDICETEDSFVVKADLPGMNKDDIQVDLKDSTLTIKGERRFEDKV
ncbi:MAG TPA: Hsp20/alpha crystallin family protein, partial [Thermodesulfobacteriota bacterium]|nr:Hsp20/alpha crystallin family protein [Thermodesulfobacteriota bacterium]